MAACLPEKVAMPCLHMRAGCFGQVKMQFRAGLVPVTEFDDDGSLSIEQTEQCVSPRRSLAPSLARLPAAESLHLKKVQIAHAQM